MDQVLNIRSLEYAQALPVVTADDGYEPFESDNPLEILSFMSTEARVMRVVVKDGEFAAIEVPMQAEASDGQE